MGRMNDSLRFRLHGVSALLFVCSFASVSQAGLMDALQRNLDVSSFNKNTLSQYVDTLQTKNQRNIKNVYRWVREAPEEARACSETYDSLFANDTLRITFAFGYHDNFEDVIDGYYYKHMVETLSRPCANAFQYVCGFKTVKGSAVERVTVLEKDVVYYRGSRRADVRIAFTVAHPSVAKRDRQNFAGGVPTLEQQRASQEVNELFFSSISGVRPDGRLEPKCDICIYYGHARNGGGPDFSPVPLDRRSEDGSTTYGAYMREMVGYRSLLNSLNQAKESPPKMVGVLACYSHKHFYDKRVCVNNEPGCQKQNLNDFTDKTGFVLTTDYSWPQNYGPAIGTVLDTILGMKCRSAWDENMEILKSPSRDKKEAFGIYGKFL